MQHRFPLVAAAAFVVGCASSQAPTVAPSPVALRVTPPTPDPRVGLKAGANAGEAIWNLRRLATAPPSAQFQGSSNSDLAFYGKYVIQGNYNGWQVWDVTTPSQPTLTIAFFCPGAQSDVSVYQNLLFVSAEGGEGRLDCAAGGARTAISHDRIRGIRIFDISDITKPKYLTNVQTCRGSHTHTVLADPKDPDNVYVYVSGSAPVRPDAELPGCSSAGPERDANSALFRIEVIKVPLKDPKKAAIVSSPRIFAGLIEPPTHGEAPEDIEAARKEAEAARARGEFTFAIAGMEYVVPGQLSARLLDSLVAARGGAGRTAADSAALRTALPSMAARWFGIESDSSHKGPKPGPTQCHDITVYPAIGLAGGACEGYGLLLDIRNPTNPVRIGEVADSNFSYWHSATFNNDGSKILFTDEWGGGGAPKCRATDKKEWGANAIFSVQDRKMTFKSYYKLPAAQTELENCVAHNGSLIPIPGRDVMIQSWYQGGISLFDWTDASNPVEIGYHDRGPIDATQMGDAGSWSVYWYNGYVYSSEIGRGLDVFELTPSPYLSQNEIDAAKSVRWTYLNAQGQPQIVWPASFALARAYLDQLERSKELGANRVAAVRQALASAEGLTGTARGSSLTALAATLDSDARETASKVRMLAKAVRDLAAR